MFNQKSPYPIDQEQVDGEEHNRNQSNDGRVLYLFGARPGNPTHLSPNVVQKLRRAGDKSGCCYGSSRLATPAFAATRWNCASFSLPGRHTSGRYRSLNAGRLGFEFDFLIAFVFAYTNFVKLLCQ